MAFIIQMFKQVGKAEGLGLSCGVAVLVGQGWCEAGGLYHGSRCHGSKGGGVLLLPPTSEHSLHMAFIIQMFKQVGGGAGAWGPRV
jgi:hypothetical protein